jgi:hypothetical protein
MVVSFGKVGLHVLRGGVKPDALKTSPVLCLVDCSVEYIQEVRAAAPNAWIVVRWVHQGEQNAALREQAARESKLNRRRQRARVGRVEELPSERYE